MKTKMMKLMMTGFAMIGLCGTVKAQDLIWEVETEEILADAESEMCIVRVDSSRRAWVLLQNDEESKLVRISSTGKVLVWDLPASDAAYNIRFIGGSSALVQAGANVTRVAYLSQVVEDRKVHQWVQRNIVLPDAGENIRYEEQAEDGDSKAIWYFVTDGDGAVTKIVLRKVP